MTNWRVIENETISLSITKSLDQVRQIFRLDSKDQLFHNYFLEDFTIASFKVVTLILFPRYSSKNSQGFQECIT